MLGRERDRHGEVAQIRQELVGHLDGREVAVLRVSGECADDDAFQYRRTGAPHRPRWLEGVRLQRRHADAMAHACDDVRSDYGLIEDRLRERLEVIRLEVNLREPTASSTFAEALAHKTRAHVDELVRHLARIASIDDRAEAHQARIMGKRLRYLVEPAREATFPLDMRIPGWCKAPVLDVNGSAVAIERNRRGFARVHRSWKPGDTVRLHLPMTATLQTGRDAAPGAAQEP